jgi:predicted MPP superfamily phosphohydrolase
MRWLGENPFHTLLLLTEKPGQWAAWQIAPASALLAAMAGLLWARVVGQPGWSWAVGLGLVTFALADWSLLAALPRWGLSFGPVQPPWLGFVLFRWSITLLAVPFGARWPLPTLVVLFLLQVLIWVLVAYGTLVEPFRLQVSEVVVSTTKGSNPGRPLRIVQLSDLHVERCSRRERALPALVAELDPDLIFLTGDFLSTTYNQDPRAVADLEALLEKLHATAGIYAVWGTIEVDLPEVLRPALEGLGIVVLEDEAVEVAIHGHRLWLMGVTCTRNLDIDGANLRTLMADAPPGAFTLLLYHVPDLMPQAAAAGVDLYLAGHTHGGQWRIPGFGAILTSSRFWKRYEAGTFREGNTLLYVSRGIGMEGFGAPRARFFCPPEVVSLTITDLEEGS